MANGNLSFDEFWNLPTEKERRKRYGELSDHDKFRVRISMDPGAVSPSCNRCKYYLKYGKCSAYPEGISGGHIRAVMEDQTIECGNGFHFTPKEQDGQKDDSGH